MATRRPLVRISGRTQQLPDGDDVGASGATTPTTMQNNLSIAAYTQMLFHEEISTQAFEINIGANATLVRVL